MTKDAGAKNSDQSRLAGIGSARQEQKNRYLAAASAAKREIGDIPPIANLDRRLSTADSFKSWCETYEADTFTMGGSPDHLTAIARIEETVRHGALFAFAMPRGSGKTSLVRAASRWAICHSLARYIFIIGANIGKAHDSLDSIKTAFRFNPMLADDFPEITHAIRELGGVANRASGQTCQGVSTMIEWSKDRVVLPTVPFPENHPHYAEGIAAATSGSIIGVSGLTGDGIRGSLVTTANNESIRPDLALIDDPQTDASAASPSQNQTRLRLIMGAVLGMAGPGKSISAMMPCTVIQPGDMVDRILDNKTSKEWRGERTKLLKSMPKDLGAWEKYREVYEQDMLRQPPDFTLSNEYYEKNRKILDAGAEASWPERKKNTEVSAVQHAMHLFFRDELAFWAEYQNDPQATDFSDEGFLTADEIASKVSGVARGVVPPGCTHVTAAIDVQGEALYWSVSAWQNGFGGQIIDYGTWPDQGVRQFTLRSLKRKLSEEYPGTDTNGAIYSGLIDCIGYLWGKEWPTVSGDSMRIAHGMVDAGWGDSKTTVYKACRDSAHAASISPSHGRGIKAGQMPIDEWKKEVGEVMGHSWRRRQSKGEGVRYVLYDTNIWKTLLNRKLAVPMGGFGDLSLYKASIAHHRQFAEHIKAEPFVRTSGYGRDLIEFKPPVAGRDNHWFDTCVMSAVAASIAGIQATGHAVDKPAKKKRIKLSDIQNRKRG